MKNSIIYEFTTYEYTCCVLVRIIIYFYEVKKLFISVENDCIPISLAVC